MTGDGPPNEQVIFVTGGYDHTIKIWQAHTGVCQRTAQHGDSVSLILDDNRIYIVTMNPSLLSRLLSH